MESRFSRFYHRRDSYCYTVYIFNLLHYIYSFGGLAYAVSTPCTLCIPFKDRYFALLFLTSTILLRFHCLFAFWSVFRPSRCGRYAFSRRVSLDELGIPLGLCMFSIHLHSSHLHINSPPHPLVRCLFPCHSAVIPRFCAGSAFPRSSGRALRFVSTITAIHWSFKPLNHPYKARPAVISNFPGRQYCIHSRIFSFFVLATGTHLLCSLLFPS